MNKMRGTKAGLLTAGVLLASGAIAQTTSKTPTTTTPRPELGVDRLVLHVSPALNSRACKSSSGSADAVTVVPQFSAATASSSVELSFTIGDITPASGNGPMVLFIAYGTTKSPTPVLSTKNTRFPLLLAVDDQLQILAAYRIQPMEEQAQTATTIGQTYSKARSRVTFDVKLDAARVQSLIAASGGRNLYVQAGLIGEADFKAGSFVNMILSEVDTIKFGTACATGITVNANQSGSKTFNTVSLTGTTGSTGKTTSGTTGGSTVGTKGSDGSTSLGAGSSTGGTKSKSE